MNVIRAIVGWPFALVYMDGIVVFSKSVVDFIKQALHVLRVLYEVGVKLRVIQCEFLLRTIDYVGPIIQPVRLKVGQHTTKAVVKLKHPSSQIKFCYVLGVCNLLKRFCTSSQWLAVPVSRTVRNCQRKQFSSSGRNRLYQG